LANAQWEWDFGDGSHSTQQDPVHTFNPPNSIYSVELRISSPSACGSVVQHRNILPKGTLPKANFDFEIKCDSGYVKFINTSSNAGSFPILWSFGDGTYSTEQNPVHTFSASGGYEVKLLINTHNICANDSLTKTVNVKLFNLRTTGSKTILEGQSVQLNAIADASSFEWSPATGLNNPGISNPIATPQQSTTYYVVAKNTTGCARKDSVIIQVNLLNDVYVPSAFTPDNDGLNDFFKPRVGNQFGLIYFSVYNRWGKLVFSTSQKGKGWDGSFNSQQQPSGVYVWALKFINKQGKQLIKTGTVVLIR